MAERYGLAFAGAKQAAAYGEAVNRDEVEVTLVPAGHVLGSAQAVVRWKGLTMVVSGDYKRRRDPTCPPFEPVPLRRLHLGGDLRPAGVPPSRRPRGGGAPAALGRPVPGALAPGRRLCAGQGAAADPAVARAGWDRTIHVHGALERLNALYERHGIDLGPLEPATTLGQEAGLRRPDRHRPAVGDPGPLEPPLPRSRPGLRVGLDAGARPGPPARRGAAAGDLRPRRLGRTDRHRRRTASGRTLDHPRAARRRSPAGPSCTACRRGRWRWSATRKRTTIEGR